MRKFIYTKYCTLRKISKLSILTAFFLFPFIYNYIPIKIGNPTFYLPSSNIDVVIDTLQEQGYGVSFIDKLMLRYLQTPSKGWYTVKEQPSQRFNFFTLLEKQHSNTLSIKLYAGENSTELVKRLANDLKLQEDKLLTIYKKHSKFDEADLFSGRYTIAKKATEDAVITTLFHYSNEKLKLFESNYENISDDILTYKVLLTIASIIQKESNHVEEMALISSVIYNRLEKDMKLQMDSTLNYGKYSHQVISASRIKTDTSQYNTYKHKGLPPTPLCTISIEALESAYIPETTNYLFFMLNRHGTHNFAATYKEHLQNIRKFKSRPRPKQKKIEEKKISLTTSSAK